MALLLINKGNMEEARVILKDIFDNEDINEMTLPIVNEYLSLLLNLDRVDEVGLVISKIALFMNASSDLKLRKEFSKLKINYLSKINDYKEIDDCIKEYEELDKEIEEENKKIFLEVLNSEKQNEVNASKNDFINKLSKIESSINQTFIGSNLRDAIMNYNRSLSAILDYDESCFVLLNKTSDLEYLLSDFIVCMNYKNNRLYQKNVSYNAIKGSVVELLLDRARPLTFDFSNSSLNLTNIFNNRLYVDDKIKYLNVIPCMYQNNVFACMIYESYTNDLTKPFDTAFFGYATKLLSFALSNVFLSQNLDITTITNERIIDKCHIGMVRICNDMMYLSDPLRFILNTNKRVIKKDAYLNLIQKSDLKNYLEVTEKNRDYTVNYKLKIDDKLISVIEDIQAYYDNDNNYIFSYGVIKKEEENVTPLIDGEKSLDIAIKELKQKQMQVEFRYSVIRVRANVSEFSKIKLIFGVSPYYSDGDFVIILENEINQNAILSLVNKLSLPYSVVRYPRDIINTDELFTISKLCLDNGDEWFSEEVYKNYLKKRNVNKLALKVINDSNDINLLEYLGYDNDKLFLAYLSIGSDGYNRAYLDDVNKRDYDMKVYQSVLDKHINGNVMIPICNHVLKRIIDTDLIPINDFNNLLFIIDEYSDNLYDLLLRLANTSIKVILSAKISQMINVNVYFSNVIRGLYLTKGLNEMERSNVIKLAQTFKLDIVSQYKINDYQKNYYFIDKVDVVK